LGDEGRNVNLKQLAEQMIEATRDYVGRQLAPILERLSALERRPAPERGERGEAGPTGRDGRDGADGVGFDDLSVAYDGERTITLKFVRGQRVAEFPIVIPFPLHRDIWEPGKGYAKGDCVTWGGSIFMATRDAPQEKPEEGSGWRLIVKRGRDGRDGAKGDKGDAGSAGRAGRDLTNMGPDGSKWA
jgi:integrin beta 3